jgi:DNA-binding transcriptional ArsR family regulator
VLADADLAAVAALMGERTRACILLALLGGAPLSASELAERARVSAPLASSHLAKLLRGGMLKVEARGRNRYYRLADREIARAIEALLAIAPERAATTLRESTHGQAIRQARTCYDHLAGELGVALTDALRRRRLLAVKDDGYSLTPAGRRYLGDLGVGIEALAAKRRPLTRQCLDWTERRPHLAGSLGAALADRLFELDWLRRVPGNRALRITSQGRDGLRDVFGVELGEPVLRGAYP